MRTFGKTAGALLRSVVLLTLGCTLRETCATAAESLLLVGTYTRGTESRGIYSFAFDDETGSLAPGPVAEGVENPSFLALHPNGKFLYSSDEVNEYEGEPAGAVSAFALERPTGKLTLLNRQPAGGTSPCHLCVDAAGKNVLVVGYGSGTVGALPLDDDGRLRPLATLLTRTGSSVDPARQTSPHPHQIVLAPGDKFAMVPDLGTDEIAQYRFDAGAGSLTPNEPPTVATAPGAGPRHLAFHPNGKWAYAINELDLTVDQFTYDRKRGVLEKIATSSAIPANADRAGVSGAEIAIPSSGKFLYASIRGRDEIVAFALNERTGATSFLQLTPTGGKTPRNFALDLSEKWLLAANQASGSIVVFRVQADGRLAATGTKIDVPAPVCLVFLR